VECSQDELGKAIGKMLGITNTSGLTATVFFYSFLLLLTLSTKVFLFYILLLTPHTFRISLSRFEYLEQSTTSGHTLFAHTTPKCASASGFSGSIRNPRRFSALLQTKTALKRVSTHTHQRRRISMGCLAVLATRQSNGNTYSERTGCKHQTL
jgi:hypothetical protein